MDETHADDDLQADRIPQTLAAAWDLQLEQLPEDWSHLLAEIELQPDTQYELVAPIVSALNPGRCDRRAAFRFRVGREFGYGASVDIARRCLEMLDKSGIEGRLRLLKVLAQRRPVETQGPIWRLRGHSL
jgi:hypothetical protein